MDHEPNHLDKLFQLWAEGAKTFSAAFQAFCDAAGQVTLSTLERSKAANPTEGWRPLVDVWVRGTAHLAEQHAEMLRRWIADLPTVAAQRLDVKMILRWIQQAGNNWEEALRRFAEAPVDIVGRIESADASRLGQLFGRMMAEYLRDLQTLSPDVFRIDLRPLAEAWGKVVSGRHDENARKAMERFERALALKARFGPEYYADSEITPVGLTPRELIYRQGKIELYHYLPSQSKPSRGYPVFLVYSVINKPFILDLIPGYSFTEHLLAEGLDVYLVEWGRTEPGDRTTTLDSYIDPGLKGCVDAIRERTGFEQVALFGHCLGGNLAMMFAALFPEAVARLVTLTTPGVASKGGVAAFWADRDLFPLDTIIDTYGHMPAKLIRYTFIALKPYYEVMKWKMFLENLGNDAVMSLFCPIDRWANENVDIPGEVFRKFIIEVFHSERFSRSETRINGQRVDLNKIRCPYMNLAASLDWIVTPDSALVLNDLVCSEDRRFVQIEGPHVAIMIDPRTRPIWKQMSDFLAEDNQPTRRPGSFPRRGGQKVSSPGQ